MGLAGDQPLGRNGHGPNLPYYELQAMLQRGAGLLARALYLGEGSLCQWQSTTQGQLLAGLCVQQHSAGDLGGAACLQRTTTRASDHCEFRLLNVEALIEYCVSTSNYCRHMPVAQPLQ
jgi:hypothetical protein